MSQNNFNQSFKLKKKKKPIKWHCLWRIWIPIFIPRLFYWISIKKRGVRTHKKFSLQPRVFKNVPRKFNKSVLRMRLLILIKIYVNSCGWNGPSDCANLFIVFALSLRERCRRKNKIVFVVRNLFSPKKPLDNVALTRFAVLISNQK